MRDKSASVLKYGKNYDLVNLWMFTLPLQITKGLHATLMYRAKRSENVLWSRETGFRFYKNVESYNAQ